MSERIIRRYDTTMAVIVQRWIESADSLHLDYTLTKTHGTGQSYRAACPDSIEARRYKADEPVMYWVLELELRP